MGSFIVQEKQEIRKYLDETFVEQLRAIKFPDSSNFTCVNDAHQDFVTSFLSEINFVAPIRTLRVKSITKTRFDIDVLNAIRNCDKHYRKFNRSGKEIDKDEGEQSSYLKK